MRKNKKIIGLLVAILLVAVVAVTVIAETEAPVYTGKVSTMQKKIALIDRAETFEEKVDAVDSAADYIVNINPAAPEYAALVAELDIRELIIASQYIANVGTKNTADDKLSGLKEFKLWFEVHTFAETTVFVDNKGTPDDPADDTVYSLEAFNNAVNQLKSSIAESYFLEACNQEKAKDKHAKLDTLLSYEKEYAPAYTGEYNKEAIEAENFICAKMLLSDIVVSKSAAKAGAGLRVVKGFVKDHTFPETVAGYSEFMSSLAQKTSAYQSLVEKSKYELELLAHLSDYSKLYTVNRDFNAIEGQTSINNIGALSPDYNIDGDINYVTENDSGADGNNGYYTIYYGKSGTHIRTNATIPVTITDSVVFECDITTFGELPNTKIDFENGAKSVNGKSLNRYYFRISPEGHLMDSTNKSIVLENAVTPGEWTHISLVLNQVTNEIKIYVDYELVKEESLAHSDGYTNVFERIRIGATPSVVGGSFSLDNVKLYAGYAPRANDSFNSYSDENKFVFCTEQIVNTRLSYEARIEYYKEAEKNVEKYWDGVTYSTSNVAVRNAVDAFFNFSDNGYQSLVETLEKQNLEELKSRISKLKSFSFGENTYSTRTYFADSADAFIARCGSFLPSGQEVSELRSALDGVRVQLAKEDVLLEFAEAVNKFYIAATLDDLKEMDKLADELYATIDRTVISGGAFPKFEAAYERYLGMDAYLKDNITIDNTKTLVAYVSYLLPYNTEEIWDANYETLKSYVFVVREILNEGDYDINYADTKELLEAFEPMNEYFYTRLQADHLSYISSEYTRYTNSKVFFEKYGILLQIKEYISSNEIDYTSEEIIYFITLADSELTKLESEREKYAEQLDINTEKFVACCEGLLGSISYAEMKKICTEAAGYYYAMNVTGSAAQDAIAVYARRCEEIETIENNATLFIAAVAGFDFEDANILATIILASKYTVLLESSIEGVDEALVRYNTEIAIYNSAAQRGNVEILSAARGALGVSNNGNYSSVITSVINRIGK